MSPATAAGFIVSWSVPSVVPLADLRRGIEACGLDGKYYAPDLKPASLVSRAGGKVAKASSDRGTRGLSRKIDLPTDRQITLEAVSRDGLSYRKLVRLGYDHGRHVLTADTLAAGGSLKTLQQEITETRKAGDVTRVLQRITEDHGRDLIPIRDGGGAYFIPAAHYLIGYLRTVVEAVGGSTFEFACTIGHHAGKGGAVATPASPSTTDRTGVSVANVITDYMLKQIGELGAAVAELGEDGKHIRSDVRRNRLTRVAELKDRLAAYSTLIEAQGARVQTALEQAESALLAKLAAAAKGVSEIEEVEAAE